MPPRCRALFGVSALYHRLTWTTAARRRLRRLDHAMIFLLIAGTYTPVGLLVLQGTLATVVLAVVWGGAVAGIVLELVWTTAPRWLGKTVYLALGWVAVVAMPQLFTQLGVAGGLLIVAGGLVYSAGAAVYGLRRPDPAPAVFGYHEIFHLLVIAGVAAHFLAIGLFAVPGGEQSMRDERSATCSLATDLPLMDGPAVRRLIHLRTLHLGPDELLGGAKVEFDPVLSLAEAAEAIDEAERRVRAMVPSARIIYLEPDC